MRVGFRLVCPGAEEEVCAFFFLVELSDLGGGSTLCCLFRKERKAEEGWEMGSVMHVGQ